MALGRLSMSLSRVAMPNVAMPSIAPVARISVPSVATPMMPSMAYSPLVQPVARPVVSTPALGFRSFSTTTSAAPTEVPWWEAARQRSEVAADENAEAWRRYDEEVARQKEVANKLANYGSVDHHFEEYRIPKTEDSAFERQTFNYTVLGAARFVYASMARLAVVRVVAYWAAGPATLAAGTIEVDLSEIAKGTTATVKWRGKPVFIRHRTEEEVSIANSANQAELKDPEEDSARVTRPEWLVVLGVCTHLGCVPLSNAGEYNGWFCPCHGSHYDLSGRIRKGPAPLNLEVPTYTFTTDTTLLLG